MDQRRPQPARGQARDRVVEAVQLARGHARVLVGGGEVGHRALDLDPRVAQPQRGFDERLGGKAEAPHPGVGLDVRAPTGAAACVAR